MAIVYKKPLVPLDLLKVFFLIIHHIDAKYATPEDIDGWHTDKGWNGAGYNEYIRKTGECIIMRGDNIGAQCLNMNSKSYGIALEGDYNVETTMPEAQMKKLVERLQYHQNRLPNKVEIVKHSKFVATSCPGQFFPFQMMLGLVEFSVDSAIRKLTQAGIITSPDYWTANAIPGKSCGGDFVGKLIVRFANKI